MSQSDIHICRSCRTKNRVPSNRRINKAFCSKCGALLFKNASSSPADEFIITETTSSFRIWDGITHELNRLRKVSGVAILIAVILAAIWIIKTYGDNVGLQLAGNNSDSLGVSTRSAVGLSNESATEELIQLANEQLEDQLAWLVFAQKLTTDSADPCNIYLSMYYPQECTLLNSQECVKKTWDGNVVANQKVGVMIGVSFRDVQEQYTVSYDYSDKFVLTFFNAPMQSARGGRRLIYDIYQESESGPLRSVFVGVSEGNQMQDNGLDKYHNLSLTGLGHIADGSDFSLTFSSGNKSNAIRLVKEIFRICH